ncbi:MAG: PRC-barrel domain-containing protein, partial [Chloroflexus sp.]
LIGTDEVRAVGSRAMGTARGAAQTLVEPARTQAGTVPGSAAGALRGMASGSGNAGGSANSDAASGLFAASGSAAAMTEGAFAIAPGMPVYSPDGDRIGKVREVIASGRGEIREVVVQGRGGARRLVDAGQLSVGGSGRGLIMGEAYARPAPEPAEPSDD